MILTSAETALLTIISNRLGVKYEDLYQLIKFESGWNPVAKNSRSSARGLLQWTDSSARQLGFSDSADMIKKNPAIADQLELVLRYLEPKKPFPTKQSLFMAVFYPAARSWDQDRVFPDTVRSANPGIDTVRDYMRLATGNKRSKNDLIIPIALIGFLIIKLFRKVKNG